MLRLICKESDPIVSVLREWLHAEILRIPNEAIRPLLVMERYKNKLHPRGTLSQLLVPSSSFLLTSEMAHKDYMADLSGVRSQSADLEIGLKIANNFLEGFGFSSGISSVMKGATKVSFSFNNVSKFTLDNGLLGNALRLEVIDRKNPANAGFFNGSDLLVIDSTIASDNFTIHVADTDKVDLKANAVEIEGLFKSSTTLKVEEISRKTISFKRRVPLPFAFTCLKFELDQAGRITGMPPARKLPFFSSNVYKEFEKVAITNEASMIDIF